ncbi:MAG: ATP-binding protein [Clostridiales bacterium]|nr:ATP-binding protein [Clostridiales bacterium]
MEKIQRRIQSQRVPSNSGDGVCPVCGGTNYRTYFELIPEYDSAFIRFGEICPQCKKQVRAQDITRVPAEFHDADITKFRFDIYQKENLTGNFRKVIMSMFQEYDSDKWRNAGRGLYLWSRTPGTGKTFLACCLAKSVMIKYDTQMRFVTVADYLGKVGDSYKRERGESDASQIYRECQLLVFDDLGAQKEGSWQDQEIFRIINGRMSNGLVTIFTSNMSPEELKLSNRTKDRIISKNLVLKMPEESIRAKRAEEGQEKMLCEILGRQEVGNG